MPEPVLEREHGRRRRGCPAPLLGVFGAADKFPGPEEDALALALADAIHTALRPDSLR